MLRGRRASQVQVTEEQLRLTTMLWDTLSIGAGDECLCGYQMQEAEIMARWARDPNTYTTQCAQCKTSFVPTLKVMYTVVVDTFATPAAAAAAAAARAPARASPTTPSCDANPYSTFFSAAQPKQPQQQGRAPSPSSGAAPQAIATGWKEVKIAIPYLCPLVLRNELHAAVRAFR